MARATPHKIEVETDPRFPSGKWTGFWLQRHYIGRQYMALELTFAGGIIRGEGADRVGDFAMTGQYDLRNGNCSIVKAYDGAHSLTYEGRNEGDGQWIWGLWRLRAFDRGGFHIWPAGMEDPTGQKLRAEATLRPPRKIKPTPLFEPVQP